MIEISEIILKLIPNNNRFEIPKDLKIENWNQFKKEMIELQGKYIKKGFEFPFNVELKLNRIKNKEPLKLKKEYQFYGTPQKICDELCFLSFDPYSNKKIKILEPSCGHGAIIDSILKWFGTKSIYLEIESIDCIEMMNENFDYLKRNYHGNNLLNLIQEDFLNFKKEENYYDVIIANPPFNKNQDIIHFKKMINLCKAGGIINCIMSAQFIYNSGKVFKEFRDFLGIEDNAQSRFQAKNKSLFFYGKNGEGLIRLLDYNSFKESGANVQSLIITFKKY